MKNFWKVKEVTEAENELNRFKLDLA